MKERTTSVGIFFKPIMHISKDYLKKKVTAAAHPYIMLQIHLHPVTTQIWVESTPACMLS